VTPAERERATFLTYVLAIGERAGHDASARQARAACPAEFAEWRAAFEAAYGYDPS
jgi:hypothetical protein